ncbi:hypothetical protein [uncultured Gelidibacter sp.]|uniref:hypothetical protein n=1 Tax=uncultured Gelidibacter sp. TaxID=259318 RepID=UPI00262B26BB|nr:hypothetical protein [uncultured Gelidibacter sp.]
MKNLILLLLSLFLGNLGSSAQQTVVQTNSDHHSHAGTHHLAVLNGATTNFTHKSTAYTVGLDYEYRISEVIGLGLLAELILGDANEVLVGIPVFVHPYKGLKLIASPLVAFTAAHNSNGHEHKKATDLYFRIGTGYDFHVNKLSFGPLVNFDVGKTTALNYGLSFGFGL